MQNVFNLFWIYNDANADKKNGCASAGRRGISYCHSNRISCTDFISISNLSAAAWAGGMLEWLKEEQY